MIKSKDSSVLPLQSIDNLNVLSGSLLSGQSQQQGPLSAKHSNNQLSLLSKTHDSFINHFQSNVSFLPAPKEQGPPTLEERVLMIKNLLKTSITGMMEQKRLERLNKSQSPTVTDSPPGKLRNLLLLNDNDSDSKRNHLPLMDTKQLGSP